MSKVIKYNYVICSMTLRNMRSMHIVNKTPLSLYKPHHSRDLITRAGGTGEGERGEVNLYIRKYTNYVVIK